MSVIDLFGVAREVQEFCDGQGWRSCFIGGIAVQRWGQPRVTRDVDLTLLTGFGSEAPFITALVERYAPRMADSAAFATRARVLLLKSAGGVGIDISLGALPFEQLVTERASLFEFLPGVNLRTCSAEDLMVMKLFASRPIDIRDAEGVAIRHGSVLDWRYVEEQLRPLAEVKDEADIMRQFVRIREVGMAS